MDAKKEEILQKSREDNGLTDERLRLAEQRMGFVAMSAATLAFVLLYAWDHFHGQNTDGLFAVFLTGLSAMTFFQAYRFRMKSLLLSGLFIASFVVYSAAKYVLATM